MLRTNLWQNCGYAWTHMKHRQRLLEYDMFLCVTDDLCCVAEHRDLFSSMYRALSHDAHLMYTHNSAGHSTVVVYSEDCLRVSRAFLPTLMPSKYQLHKSPTIISRGRYGAARVYRATWSTGLSLDVSHSPLRVVALTRERSPVGPLDLRLTLWAVVRRRTPTNLFFIFNDFN